MLNPSLARLAVVLVSFMFLAACATVPGTGRSQLNLVNDQQIVGIAAQQYALIKQKMPASGNQQESARVQKVGGNIVRAAEVLLKEQGQTSRLAHVRWEFALFQNNQVNAFAAPGGKIGIFTGILPFTRNDAGLAVIIGHEVAHVIARHAQERMSQQLLTQMGGQALEIGLTVGKADARLGAVAMVAYGLGSMVGVELPYSRAHEYEADRLGMILMAMAGYDPAAAVDVWQRMASAGQGGKTLAFLSTHPASHSRLEEMRKRMPEAQARYSGRPAPKSQPGVQVRPPSVPSRVPPAPARTPARVQSKPPTGSPSDIPSGYIPPGGAQSSAVRSSSGTQAVPGSTLREDMARAVRAGDRETWMKLRQLEKSGPGR